MVLIPLRPVGDQLVLGSGVVGLDPGDSLELSGGLPQYLIAAGDCGSPLDRPEQVPLLLDQEQVIYDL